MVKVVCGRSDHRMDQGNLLWGIDNCSGATRSVVKVRYKALDNSFSNNVSLFQLKSNDKGGLQKTLCKGPSI